MKLLSLHMIGLDDFSYIDNSLHYLCCRYCNQNVLDDISEGSKFNNCTYNICKSNGSYAPAWRRMDDRYNTLYGSTYEVPLSLFEVHSEEYEFIICGDTHLMSNHQYFNIKYAYAPEDMSIDNDLYLTARDIAEEQILDTVDKGLLTLESIITKSYPNSTITKFGNFTLPYNSYLPSIGSTPIEQLYNYLQNEVTYPDFIVVNGLEYAYSIGVNVASIIRYLIDMSSINNIHLLFVTDPFYSTSINYSSFKESIVDSCIPNNMLFDLYEWLNNRNESYTYTNNSQVSNNRLVFNRYFPDYVYNCLNDHIFDMWNLPVHRDKFYLSLVNVRLDDESFARSSNGNVSGVQDRQDMRRFYSSLENKLGDDGQTEIDWPTEYFRVISKYGSSQTLSAVKNPGIFVAMIIHTGYSDSLLASQQFQANVMLENLCRNDEAARTFLGEPLLNLMPIRSVYNSESSKRHLSVYPTTGAPWLILGDINKQEYSSDFGVYATNKVVIDFWISLSNSWSLTLSVRIRAPKGKLDNWQSMSGGKLLNTETANESFPLFCGGGSLAISNDVYVFDPYGGTRTYVAGNSYDLDFNSICMCNSNILHPTKFNGAGISTFKVLNGEGWWQNIFAHKQDAHITPYPTTGIPPDYCTVLDDVQFYSNVDHCLLPIHGDVRWLTSTEYMYSHGYSNYEGRNHFDNKRSFNTWLVPLSVFIKESKSHYERQSNFGIDGIYATFDFDIPSGEYTYNNNKYLIMPCGWESRLYSYKNHIGVYNDEWDVVDVVDNYESYTLVQTKNVIYDKLVIKLR